MGELPVGALLLDVAGTLLVKPDLPNAIVAALSDAGLACTADEVARHHAILTERTQFPDRPDRGFYLELNASLLEALGLPASPELAGAINERCTGLPWVVAPGARELVTHAARAGVISNWDDTLAATLAEMGFAFEVVVGSADVGLRKPDPAIFSVALERLGPVTGPVVYVGDSVRLDVEPAERVGMISILVDRLDLHGDHPGRRVRSLEEVPGVIEGLRPA